MGAPQGHLMRIEVYRAPWSGAPRKARGARRPGRSAFKMKAVITAGGRITGEYARETGTSVKALVKVRGVTMLERIVDALRGAGATRIAVVGGEEVRAACNGRVELVVDEAKTGAENLVRALRAWPQDGEPLIYATSDMPYVGAANVTRFLQRVPRDHVALPLAEHAEFYKRFPGAPPCGITLAGECVVNGDVFYVPGGVIEKVENAPAVAVRGCDPELAFDADTLADYRYVSANP
jgi:CTP:molybdopterin cytidylyltransferase MocA